MSDKLNILEGKVEVIEQKLDSLSIEFKNAFNYLQTDPAGSLNKTRIVMEKILVDIYQREMGFSPKKKMLGDILKDNQFTRKIERRILSRIHAIRDMSNLGTHGESVHKEDAIDILDNLIAVLMWYFGRYLNIKIDFKKPNIINKEKSNKTTTIENIEEKKATPRVESANKRKINISDRIYYLAILPVVMILINTLVSKTISAIGVYEIEFFQTFLLIDFILTVSSFFIFWFFIRYKPTANKFYPIFSVVLIFILARMVSYLILSITNESVYYSFTEYFANSIKDIWIYLFLILDVVFVFVVNSYYSKQEIK